MNQQPQFRLYEIGNKKVFVQAVDFSLFHEHLRSINKEWKFLMVVDEVVNFQQMTIVEGSAKILEEKA
jgi:hypothetical protein